MSHGLIKNHIETKSRYIYIYIYIYIKEGVMAKLDGQIISLIMRDIYEVKDFRVYCTFFFKSIEF